MILYLIGCQERANTGRGGHYHSLRTLAAHIGIENRIRVFGDFFPPVLADLRGGSGGDSGGGDDIDPVRLYDDRRDGPERICVEEPELMARVRLVHAFDLGVGFIGNRLATRLRVPFVVTKPGGPVRPSAPVFRHMIVFHRADYDFLRGRGVLAPRRIALIPQRVAAPPPAAPARPDPFAAAPPGALRILRIARIGAFHRRSIAQTLALGRHLRALGFETHVAIVGHLEDAAVLRDLLGDRPEGVSVHTDETMTREAAELLPHADVVVGAGRSFIEGMAAGKRMFFPVAEGALPCFATERTYGPAFEENFSERVAIPAPEREAAMGRFLDTCRDAGARERSEDTMRRLFRHDHAIETGAEKTRAFYRTLRANGPIDDLVLRGTTRLRRTLRGVASL